MAEGMALGSDVGSLLPLVWILAVAFLVAGLMMAGGAMTGGIMGGMAGMMGTPWGWSMLLVVLIRIVLLVGSRLAVGG